MDPNATLRELVEALNEEDVVTAYERAEALYKWLGNGGWLPAPNTARPMYGWNLLDRTGIKMLCETIMGHYQAAMSGEGAEACPGCGCLPGHGLTEGCTHPDGCGFFRPPVE